jgi:AcrR family transcriptional regulator
MSSDGSPGLRERRSQLTREEVLTAARRLFAERGYARTSVRDIAAAAGVSPQTVYDSVGSKSALVARLNDLIDTEAGVGALARAMAESDDPAYVVGTSARITRAILETCSDVLRTLVAGAADEPDLAQVLEEGHRRHVAGARSVVERLRRLEALPRGVDTEDAAQALAATSDFRIGLVLHDGYGWSLDRVEEWTASQGRALLAGSTSS